MNAPLFVDVAELLRAHALTHVQAVKPFRLLWRCPTCELDWPASEFRLSVAQSEHQAAILAWVGVGDQLPLTEKGASDG